MKHTPANYIKLSPGGPMWIRETAKKLLEIFAKKRKTLEMVKTDGKKLFLYDQDIKKQEFTLQDLQQILPSDLASYMKAPKDLEMVVQSISSAMERGFNLQSFEDKSGNTLSYTFAPKEDEWSPMIRGEMGRKMENLTLSDRVINLAESLNEGKVIKSIKVDSPEAEAKAEQAFKELIQTGEWAGSARNQLVVIRKQKVISIWIMPLGLTARQDYHFKTLELKYKTTQEAIDAYNHFSTGHVQSTYMYKF